jgi:SAM-dependent methyltransferase
MVMSCLPHDPGSAKLAPAPSVEWEECACLLCGSRNWSPLVEGPDAIPGGSGLWFVVVQCQDCGLCFTNPRPSASSIGQFYPAAYVCHSLPRVRRPRPWWKTAFRWLRRSNKERRTLPPSGQGRLLDFGCGGGSFLARMRQRGWKVMGLDCSLPTVQRVQSELGLEALCGTLPNADLESGSFDLITMWQALEHVHQPFEVLRDAHRLLAPGGKLLVAVPNIDSLPFRWFGHCWYGLDLPRHLTHFSPWTLYLMLHRAGFRVGPVRMVRHSGWLRRSARRARQNPPATRWQRILAHKPTSRLAAWYSSLTNQSDGMLVVAER